MYYVYVKAKVYTKHHPELQINTEISKWIRSSSSDCDEDEVRYAVLVDVRHNKAVSPGKAMISTVNKTYAEFRQFRAALGLSEEGEWWLRVLKIILCLVLTGSFVDEYCCCICRS